MQSMALISQTEPEPEEPSDLMAALTTEEVVVEDMDFRRPQA